MYAPQLGWRSLLMLRMLKKPCLLTTGSTWHF
jgi:hypothetical protein